MCERKKKKHIFIAVKLMVRKSQGNPATDDNLNVYVRTMYVYNFFVVLLTDDGE